MTNIQAINLLKGLEQRLNDYCELNDEGETAFYMAITALEPFGISEQLTSKQAFVAIVNGEPTIEPEPCDDAVSRKEAVGWFEEYKRKSDEMYEAMREELMEAPSVTPKPKTGKWINHRNDRGHNIADCDQCGETMQWYDPDPKPNYCPNCGVKMEGCNADT